MLRSLLIISRVIDERIENERISGAGLFLEVVAVAFYLLMIEKQLVDGQGCNTSKLFLTIFRYKRGIDMNI